MIVWYSLLASQYTESQISILFLWTKFQKSPFTFIDNKAKGASTVLFE